MAQNTQGNNNGIHNNPTDSAYGNPKFNPDYGERFEGPDWEAYRSQVYFKISSLS